MVKETSTSWSTCGAYKTSARILSLGSVWNVKSRTMMISIQTMLLPLMKSSDQQATCALPCLQRQPYMGIKALEVSSLVFCLLVWHKSVLTGQQQSILLSTKSSNNHFVVWTFRNYELYLCLSKLNDSGIFLCLCTFYQAIFSSGAIEAKERFRFHCHQEKSIKWWWTQSLLPVPILFHVDNS